MDFMGQKLAESIMSAIIIVFAVVSFLVGYPLGDFKLMAQINGVGLGLAALAMLPNWPCYNKHPLPWLPPLNPPQAKKQ